MNSFDAGWSFDLQESQFPLWDSHSQFDYPNDFYHESPFMRVQEEGLRLSLIPLENIEKLQEITESSNDNSQKHLFESHEENGLEDEKVTKKAKTQRRKRIPKPSPYHNFQKHLNSTMKQLLFIPPIIEESPVHYQIASQLWNVFKKTEKSTKKILNFIFNQFNEHLIKDEELRQSGFYEIYQEHSREELGQAKNYLTELALAQLTNESLDDYLQTRRIKNPAKFKKYLLQFRKELQDGFIKKRFTNRSRKEKVRELLHSQQI